MKNFKTVLIFFVATMLLTACGVGNDVNAGNNDSNAVNEVAADDSDVGDNDADATMKVVVCAVDLKTLDADSDWVFVVTAYCNDEDLVLSVGTRADKQYSTDMEVIISFEKALISEDFVLIVEMLTRDYSQVLWKTEIAPEFLASDLPEEVDSDDDVDSTDGSADTIAVDVVVFSDEFDGVGSWEVAGVPETAVPWKIFQAGDVFGTTATLSNAPSVGFGEPGVRTMEDCVEADADISAFCSLRTNIQQTLMYLGTAQFELPEGSEQGPGHGFISGAYFTATMSDGVVISCDTPEDVTCHLWVTGYENADLSTPDDGNSGIIVEGFNPGFTMVNVLPPGQRISEEYRQQQIEYAMEHECGNDGCTGGVLELHYNLMSQTLTVVFFGPDGKVETLYQNWVSTK